ncbi:hypothetical protein DESC_180011 [Desulfosarcina cetonica]|nr:hypothetical protein DESC_180011 [Desulfosarcina cetonica]
MATAAITDHFAYILYLKGKFQPIITGRGMHWRDESVLFDAAQVALIAAPGFEGIQMGQQIPALQAQHANLPDGRGFDAVIEDLKNAAAATGIQPAQKVEKIFNGGEIIVDVDGIAHDPRGQILEGPIGPGMVGRRGTRGHQRGFPAGFQVGFGQLIVHKIRLPIDGPEGHGGIHAPLAIGLGVYMAVSGWNTATSLRSSKRYSRSLGPRTPKERQIKVHRWTTP